jgi:hypothetical protein
LRQKGKSKPESMRKKVSIANSKRILTQKTKDKIGKSNTKQIPPEIILKAYNEYISGGISLSRLAKRCGVSRETLKSRFKKL